MRASCLCHSPLLLASQRDLGELGEVLGVFLFYLYPEEEVESFITTQPLCNSDRFHVHFCVAQLADTHEWALKKSGSGHCYWQVFMATWQLPWTTAEGRWRSRYLSRTNSAISFCICFPFSCFCSNTSNPVMQPLPWGSFLSVCEINTSNILIKHTQHQTQAWSYWGYQRETAGWIWCMDVWNYLLMFNEYNITALIRVSIKHIALPSLHRSFQPDFLTAIFGVVGENNKNPSGTDLKITKFVSVKTDSSQMEKTQPPSWTHWLREVMQLLKLELSFTVCGSAESL